MIRRPLFIVGMPRSGTTLLSSVLDAHSSIAISPETHFYARCQATENHGSVGEVWACLQQQPGVQDMNLTEKELSRIEAQFRDQSDCSPSDVLRALETTYASRYDAQIWGEKTPDHLPHVPKILRDFPNALILSIVRDSRDVCLSLAEMSWNRDSLFESAWKWRRYAEATERYEEKYSNQFREVRYEDMLSDFETMVRDILDWIDVPFEEGVLAYHRQEHDLVDTDREPWKAKTSNPIDPTNQEKWRDQMSQGAQFVVEVLTRPLLERKGYSSAVTSLGPRGVAELVAEAGRAVGTIARRLWRTFRMPAREPGNYTPDWIREQNWYSSREE